jgi:hypothetical protein
MSTAQFDDRVNELEGRLDKAEGLLGSAGQVLRTIERAHDRVDRGTDVPFLLIAAGTIVGATVVFLIARRLDSAR